MTIPKDNKKLNKARSLRKEMTPQERHLWYDFLRYYPMKVYKQRIIGPYIVDFYCAGAKLVIEIDGSQHYEEKGQRYDAQRTEYLESYGLKVIRFSNTDINVRFRAVCEYIDQVVSEIVGDSPLRHG